MIYIKKSKWESDCDKVSIKMMKMIKRQLNWDITRTIKKLKL